MKKLIATHNKIFHADEISAIALLEIFTDYEIEIKRVNHDTKEFDIFDFVIDVGKKFDGKKYFDHHQFKGGKSSAGLIWDYLGFSKQYPKISKLIELIDRNDVGLEKAKPFEFSSLIKCYNTRKVTSKEQEEAFYKALDFTKTVFSSMKQNEDDVIKAKEIVNNSYIFNGNPKIIELDEFTPHWSTYINGETMPYIKAVVWEDQEENNWKVKIPAIRIGTFELNGNPLKQDNNMEFVHSSGHFAIAKDELTMIKYLSKNI
ncbi:MYG1 family protein [Aliarcobacter cryaerophilus]|uniref:MYG1 family protein n=1 Tax=Aliarcobacter cryaerophilus TaxID=28198 RepID=UPI003DA356A5